MTASGDDDGALSRARARIAELEGAIAERDRTLASLHAAREGDSPKARHRALVRELEAQLETARREVDELTRARRAP